MVDALLTDPRGMVSRSSSFCLPSKFKLFVLLHDMPVAPTLSMVAALKKEVYILTRYNPYHGDPRRRTPHAEGAMKHTLWKVYHQ